MTMGDAAAWFERMQEVASRFAGDGQASAAQVAQAWREAFGAAGGNPFAEAWQREGAGWLGLPAFGFAREHQERWQRLGQAQLDYQRQAAAYSGLMMRAGQDALAVFERKLAERGASGEPVGSARELFDLWIDAAEEAYARVALSPEFREVYGELVNAQMRLRGGVQLEVEQVAGQWGMPTRSEVDAAHRKITELQREVRTLRDMLQERKDPAPAPRAAKKAARKRSAPKRRG